MTEETTLIYGKHAVREALMAMPSVVRTVFTAKDFDDSEFMELVKQTKVARASFDGQKPPKGVSPDAVHQGVVASIAVDELIVDFDSFIEALTISPDTALVILGEVQDPHNVGAVIRSAVAFGVAGILIPEHRQAPITGTVIKVSAGMAFRVPLVSIGNVNQAVHTLKERGFWIYGLDGEASQTIYEEGFEKPSAFILGNEATGIRKKTLEHCDIPLRIPMHARTESLNASAAAAVVLSAWSIKHPSVLR
jgi:23S rRNA (guanosine2251-2'-O)-methyltransferase